MTLSPPVVGILGGMGPAATVDFYRKLVAATPAATDQEHLPVVIWSDPRVPDRTAALVGDGEDPTPVLRAGVAGLAAAGVRLLAVACNTAHAFVPPLAAAAGLELISIIDVTAQRLAATLPAGATVGLLATEGTVASRLYHDACAAVGLTVLVPEPAEQARVTAAIAAVKAGTADATGAAALAEVLGTLRDAGAEAAIAGCTEIVLALAAGTDADPVLPVVDPADLLAHEVVRRARELRPDPADAAS
ncbi:aspartate/glutamate racemase family protein [Actinocatenispora sera]|uniref:Aspartate racemase n=1 Tax=Actinocatenispora sera TaxID=390989 RepID=A0A810LAA8_9ACTN|nr:amino acid racemase [Actinocatenispora sera]BCJ32213.1 aspartate racemase [Actinocatenispora sera]